MKFLLNTGYSQYILPDSRTDNVTGSIGFSYDVSETWNLLAEGGLRRTKSKSNVEGYVFDPEQQASVLTKQRQDAASRGRVGQVSLNYQGEYTGVSFGYSKDLSLAPGIQAVSDQDALSATVQYRIAYELTAFLTTGYTMLRSDSQNSAQIIRQKSYSLAPVIRYDFTQDVAVEASYERYRIDYQAANTELHRELYFIRLTTRFPYCSSSPYK
jgi:hypothetical protein